MYTNMYTYMYDKYIYDIYMCVNVKFMESYDYIILYKMIARMVIYYKNLFQKSYLWTQFVQKNMSIFKADLFL